MVSTPLTNINDQFSYAVRVPFETELSGFTLSGNTLALPASTTSYTRSVTVNGVSASFVVPGQSTFTFSALDRGKMERVDLSVTLPFVDSGDLDGLDDNWERAHFGNLSAGPNDDPDHDGMSNYAEYKAGTNPNDPQSRFAFISIKPVSPVGLGVSWSSTGVNRYSVHRSSDILGTYTPIATSLLATPGTNYYHDATASSSGPWFYRIRVE